MNKSGERERERGTNSSRTREYRNTWCRRDGVRRRCWILLLPLPSSLHPFRFLSPPLSRARLLLEAVAIGADPTVRPLASRVLTGCEYGIWAYGEDWGIYGPILKLLLGFIELYMGPSPSLVLSKSTRSMHEIRIPLKRLGFPCPCILAQMQMQMQTPWQWRQLSLEFLSKNRGEW